MDSKFTDTGLLLLLSLWAGQYVVGVVGLLALLMARGGAAALI